jgi:hypothetical protein
MRIIDTIHQNIWEELLGKVNAVEEKEGLTFAQIGKIVAIFPIGMIDQLRKLRGEHIGIIRTDKDFRIRTIPEAANENCGKPSPVSVFIFDRDKIKQIGELKKFQSQNQRNRKEVTKGDF